MKARAKNFDYRAGDDSGAVVAAMDRLTACPDLDALFRCAVQEARVRLGLERVAIFVMDGDGGSLRGTFGTDRHGRTTDERRYRISSTKAWVRRFQESRRGRSGWVVVRGTHHEWNGRRAVTFGRGWTALTPIRLGAKLLGVLCNDAAMSGVPVDVRQQDRVAMFCSLLASMIDRKRAEDKHRAMVAGLRAVVAVADQLITSPDLDSLFYRAVTFAKNELGLERCGILLKFEGGVRGTYGTDRHGNIVNERTLIIPDADVWTERLKVLRPDRPRWIVFKQRYVTFDGKHSHRFGYGWVVVTPIHSSTEPIGVLCNDAALSRAPLDETKQDVVSVFCSLLGDMIKRKRAEEALRGLEHEVVKISDHEQQRIGQDLHDGLGQHLTASGFAATLLEQTLAEKALPEASAAGNIARMISEATSKARNLASCLYPVELEKVGLAGALEQLSFSIRNLYGIDVRVHCPRVVNIRAPAVANHLYRIAQEAANNAVKHGKPRKVTIGLSRKGRTIRLSVQDDGIGIPKRIRTATGMGLSIMAYRAEVIGATLQIMRSARGGTIVTCTHPNVKQHGNHHG